MKREYIRLPLKRSTKTGETPTIPIDENDLDQWLDTDIMVGEIFINSVDDGVYIRSENGILEFMTSKGSGYGGFRTTNDTNPELGFKLIETGFRYLDGSPFVPYMTRVSTGVYRLDFTGAVNDGGVQLSLTDILIDVQTIESINTNATIEYEEAAQVNGGNYVTIHITDHNGVYKNSQMSIMSETIIQPNLIANFSVDDDTPISGTPVQFMDLSYGNPTSWLWDFGDGNTSTIQNPTHSYI